MKVLFEYSKGCDKHPNEDIYGYSDNVFWVIDGATAVFTDNYLSSGGDIHWTVNELNSELKKTPCAGSLAKMLRNSIAVVRNRAIAVAPILNSINQNELPTFAICMIRINENTLEYAILGDCSVITSSNPCKRYSDDRILPFHFMINDVKEQFKNNPEVYKIKVKEAVQGIKKHINQRDGYCIGTFDPDSALLAVEGKIPICRGDRILLCSDGFQPSILEAKLVKYNEREYFDPQKLDSLIQRQHEAEKRYKKKNGIDISDDETVVLIEV